MKNKDFVGIILAAGESTRMKSDSPKVLHPILGRPMLDYVIKAITGSGIERLLVVIGFKKEMVMEMFRGNEIEFVTQTERLGTAHAVLQAFSYLEDFDGNCLITCGDTPLVSEETLNEICREHEEERADLTLLTACLDDPTGYGRILRDHGKRVVGIVEERDATPDQKAIKEINTGIYCFKCILVFFTVFTIFFTFNCWCHWGIIVSYWKSFCYPIGYSSYHVVNGSSKVSVN